MIPLQLQCNDENQCGPNECCLQISCNSIEKKPKVDVLTVCSLIPQIDHPCHLGSNEVAFTCPCGQNLTCSHSEGTKYGQYREKYYKCLCKHSDDTKKCDKYKKDMERYQSNPGSVCRSDTHATSLVLV